ncbi:MAG TPA: hypothetical protein VHB70_11555 [Parafilimonas sp.]|nr:hypothetical protein [Parafilimonas sp.]
MNICSEEIIQTIQEDQKSKGVVWDGNKPVNVNAFEWKVSITNTEVNGKIGAADFYSFKILDFHRAIQNFLEVCNELQIETPHIDNLKMLKIKKNKEIYLKVKFSKWN